MNAKEGSISRPPALEANTHLSKLLSLSNANMVVFDKSNSKSATFSSLLYNKRKKVVTLHSQNRDVAQLASAPRSGRGGRKFESSHPDSTKNTKVLRLSCFLCL